MAENPTRQSEFDHQRQLNDENTIGVVNVDLGEEYSTTLVPLKQLEELVEHAREEIDSERVFVHCADDSPVLISKFSNANAAVGLSPVVTVEEAERIRGEKDAE